MAPWWHNFGIKDFATGVLCLCNGANCNSAMKNFGHDKNHLLIITIIIIKLMIWIYLYLEEKKYLTKFKQHNLLF